MYCILTVGKILDENRNTVHTTDQKDMMNEI